MTEHYIFVDDSWYDNPPCDCCKGCWVDSYNCISHDKPEYTLGSEEEIVMELVRLNTDLNPWDECFDHLEDREQYFKNILDNLEITYEIQGEFY